MPPLSKEFVAVIDPGPALVMPKIAAHVIVDAPEVDIVPAPPTPVAERRKGVLDVPFSEKAFVIFSVAPEEI